MIHNNITVVICSVSYNCYFVFTRKVKTYYKIKIIEKNDIIIPDRSF